MNPNVENIIMECVEVEVAQLNDTISKRVAKPKLPAKLERNMIFGYWFANMLFSGNFIDNSIITIMYDKLRIYESLENQTDLYMKFESEFNATQKTLRKSIADYHKPPKATRASKKSASTSDDQVVAQKKGRKKKTTEVVTDNNDDFITQLVAVANSRNDAINDTNVVTTEIVTTTTNLKKKSIAKPVEPVSVSSPETVQSVKVTPNIIINPLNSTGVPENNIPKITETVDVLVAVSEKKPRKKAEPKAKPTTNEPTTNEPTTNEPKVKEPKAKSEPKAKEPKVKEPKVKEPKAKAEPKVKEPKVKEPKAKSEPKVKEPKAKSEPKAKENVVEAPIETTMVSEAIVDLMPEVQDNEDDNDEEIHAREFIYNGKQYLIDENTNDIYDFETQDLIGVYDPNTKIITF